MLDFDPMQAALLNDFTLWISSFCATLRIMTIYGKEFQSKENFPLIWGAFKVREIAHWCSTWTTYAVPNPASGTCVSGCRRELARINILWTCTVLVLLMMMNDHIFILAKRIETTLPWSDYLPSWHGCVGGSGVNAHRRSISVPWDLKNKVRGLGKRSIGVLWEL